MLHRLAAIKLIRELEQEESSLDFRGIAEDVERLKQEIIEISCQNGILITESSFLSILHSHSEQSYLIGSDHITVHLIHCY